LREDTGQHVAECADLLLTTGFRHAGEPIAGLLLPGTDGSQAAAFARARRAAVPHRSEHQRLGRFPSVTIPHHWQVVSIIGDSPHGFALPFDRRRPRRISPARPQHRVEQ
jgi:hypothetical protein